MKSSPTRAVSTSPTVRPSQAEVCSRAGILPDASSRSSHLQMRKIHSLWASSRESSWDSGTNWSVLAKMSGPIQGPLLSYETFTAFMLEASFFGVLVFGRKRVPPWFYLFSTAMVALGTTFSAFWIMVNNSWMQVPTGYVVENGAFVPNDWTKIIFNSAVWSRFPHMILAAFLTGAFCVAATGAWYLLREKHQAEGRVMLRMGLFLAAVLVPV